MAKTKSNKTRSKRANKGSGDRDLALSRSMPTERIFRTTRMFTNGLTTPVSDTGSYIQHALSDLPQLTDFTNAFQEYRIVGVEIQFSLVGHSATPVYPTLYLVEDKADIVLPTSLNNLISVGSCVVHDFSPTKNQFKRNYQPAPQIGAWQGTGLVTGYALDSNKRWISTQYPNVIYYGMKYWLGGFNTTFPNLIMNYRARYTVELRGFK
jgi:hypothetical protein